PYKRLAVKVVTATNKSNKQLPRGQSADGQVAIQCPQQKHPLMDPLFSQGFARDPQSIGNKNLKNLALFRYFEGSGEDVLLHRFHSSHQIR
ncbi:hypothetical protein NW820_11625, partial [Synechococcus sp. R55.7]|uniref:hypothetical protein n=1 Tax=Synechococcus sp. R55.7 TaxID=2964500 RepID=UPI0039C24702